MIHYTKFLIQSATAIVFCILSTNVSAQSLFKLNSGSASAVMYEAASGNIGIGTTTPGTLLQVFQACDKSG